MNSCSNCRKVIATKSFFGMPLCSECYLKFEDKHIQKKKEQDLLREKVQLTKHGGIKVRYCSRCQETFYTRFKRPKVCPACYHLLSRWGVNIIKKEVKA